MIIPIRTESDALWCRAKMQELRPEIIHCAWTLCSLGYTCKTMTCIEPISRCNKNTTRVKDTSNAHQGRPGLAGAAQISSTDVVDPLKLHNLKKTQNYFSNFGQVIGSHAPVHRKGVALTRPRQPKTVL